MREGAAGGPSPPLHGAFVRSEEFLLHMNQESEETGDSHWSHEGRRAPLKKNKSV